MQVVRSGQQQRQGTGRIPMVAAGDAGGKVAMAGLDLTGSGESMARSVRGMSRSDEAPEGLCPICRKPVVPDPRNHGKYLCYGCKKRIPASALVLPEPEPEPDLLFDDDSDFGDGFGPQPGLPDAGARPGPGFPDTGRAPGDDGGDPGFRDDGFGEPGGWGSADDGRGFQAGGDPGFGREPFDRGDFPPQGPEVDGYGDDDGGEPAKRGRGGVIALAIFLLVAVLAAAGWFSGIIPKLVGRVTGGATVAAQSQEVEGDGGESEGDGDGDASGESETVSSSDYENWPGRKVKLDDIEVELGETTLSEFCSLTGWQPKDASVLSEGAAGIDADGSLEVDMQNSKYPHLRTAYVELSNHDGTGKKAPGDCEVASICIDTAMFKTYWGEPLPELELSGGIELGGSYEDVKAKVKPEPTENVMTSTSDFERTRLVASYGWVDYDDQRPWKDRKTSFQLRVDLDGKIAAIMINDHENGSYARF